MIRKAAYIFFLVLVPTALFGQGFHTFSVTGGYTIPNSEEWSYISDRYLGIDIAEARMQHWMFVDDTAVSGGQRRLLRRPYQMGLRGNFTFYPNAIAGHKFGLAGFVIEPLLERGGHSVGLEMDAGFAFYSNPYKHSHDEANVFIGSYVNCLIQIGLSYSYTLSGIGDIVFAGKFVHSSNGYLVKPNKGLNYLQGELGFRPRPMAGSGTGIGADSRIDYRFSAADIRGGDWFVSYAPAIVMPRFPSKRHEYYYAHTARMGWLYHFNAARAAGVNLDITYNYSFNELYEIFQEEWPLPFFVGIAAAYEASYHRLTLHTALCAYLLRAERGTTPMYERVGVFYNLGDQTRRLRQFVGVSLKSHMAHIDFIEWHYGIRFR